MRHPIHCCCGARPSEHVSIDGTEITVSLACYMCRDTAISITDPHATSLDQVRELALSSWEKGVQKATRERVWTAESELKKFKEGALKAEAESGQARAELAQALTVAQSEHDAMRELCCRAAALLREARIHISLRTPSSTDKAARASIVHRIDALADEIGS